MFGLLGVGGVDAANGPSMGDFPASLRLRSSNNSYLSKNWVQGTNPTDSSQYKRFISFKVKRGKLGSIQLVATNTLTTNGNYAWQIYFDANDKLNLWTNPVTGTLALVSDMVFRDPTSWYYIDILHDVTQATPSARTTVWVNGAAITTTGTAATQNNQYDGFYLCPPLAGTWGVRIGNSVMNGVGANQLDAYIARFCIVDNPSSVTQNSVGQLDSVANEWKTKDKGTVKSVVDAGGNNSFMLDFDDPNFATYGVGKDYSSKGNHFTPTNINATTAGATYDYMKDVPGNSYATFNPLASFDSYSAITYEQPSNGNLKCTSTGSNYGNLTLTQAMTSGKWYVESYVETADSGVGIKSHSGSVVNSLGYDGVNSWGWHGTGNFANNSSSLASYSAFTAGDILMMAYDAATRKFWIGKNGVWQNSGNPDAGTGYVAVLNAGVDYFFAAGDMQGTAGVAYSLSPGQAPLISGAAFDSTAGGYFKYSPSSINASSFKALCQANMATPAISNPKDAFVKVLDTKANVLSTLATARAGWTSYIDIIKNRDTAENWAYSFSHDSSNEYSVAYYSVTRQARRSMTGADRHVAYSIRIGSAYGTAAGSVSHTTGSSTTVTHSLGTSRQVIILFPRTAGSSLKTYHPNLTAGKLVDLCQIIGETTDGSLTSIGSNSFQIGSGMATGTYDYLVLSEIAGLNKFCMDMGNGSADGPYTDTGGKPGFVLHRNRDVTNPGWYLHDSLRDPINYTRYQIRTNGNQVEADYGTPYGWAYDFLSSGFKRRGYASGDTEWNYPGSNFIDIVYNDVAAKYSLAR